VINCYFVQRRKNNLISRTYSPRGGRATIQKRKNLVVKRKTKSFNSAKCHCHRLREYAGPAHAASRPIDHRAVRRTGRRVSSTGDGRRSMLTALATSTSRPGVVNNRLTTDILKCYSVNVP